MPLSFMHATLCSSVISTWCNAIDKGYFPTWPTLTSKQIRKHAPFSPPMIKVGHVGKWPLSMALHQVDMTGLHRVACIKATCSATVVDAARAMGGFVNE